MINNQTQFKQTELGPIPEDWEVLKLRDCCDFVQYGYTQSASEIENGPKFLRITDIQTRIVDWESVPFCKISNSELQKYQLKAGDIVIARTGASTGANAICGLISKYRCFLT